MSMNKTWAISSWISFLISADMFRCAFQARRKRLFTFYAARRADKIIVITNQVCFFGEAGYLFM